MSQNGLRVRADYTPVLRNRDLLYHFLYRWRSILAAVLAFFCFVFSDTICVYGFWLLSRPLIFLEAMLQIFLSWFSPSMSGILSTLFRLGGIVTAFQNARIF